MDGLDVKDGVYGVYHPDYDAHVFRRIHFDNVNSEPINRGHDDESVQYGTFTYDDVRLENCRVGRDPLIQMACTSPRAGAFPAMARSWISAAARATTSCNTPWPTTSTTTLAPGA
jgi:hypothetical protein